MDNNFSYWEIKSWFSNVDFTIIGSGIVGLNCALELKQKHPKANVLILEKGILPQGASTKNAGFACFGSISEIIADLESHSEEEVIDLIQKRWNGLQLLRKNLGDSAIDFQQHGGYEIFSKKDDLFSKCLQKKEVINQLLHPVFKQEVFTVLENIFDFNKIQNQCFFNRFEGQLDTGKMMTALLRLAHKKGVKTLNNTHVKGFSEANEKVSIKTNRVDFNTRKLLIATNGFASQLLHEDVCPARAQVLITKPINNLKIKGTFHLELGNYYFRNIDNRILLGGGRSLDFKTEETTQFGQTVLVQEKLEELLKFTILPNTTFEIESRWSGIMGVGKKKKAIVKQVSNNVYCGVRLGGMGIAIGSIVGKELADLI